MYLAPRMDELCTTIAEETSLLNQAQYTRISGTQVYQQAAEFWSINVSKMINEG